jgi:hypothetical protein
VCFIDLILNAQTISFEKKPITLTAHVMHLLQPSEDKVFATHLIMLQNSPKKILSTIFCIHPIQYNLLACKSSRVKQRQNYLQRSGTAVQADINAWRML